MLLIIAFAGCVPGGNTDPDGEEPYEEPPKVYYQEAFTGREQGLNYAEGQRPVAVMIDNNLAGGSQMAWPQKGLSKADAVFEMETEGGITRMMGLFRDWNNMTITGPIRSARDQFVQMMMPYGSLYVHDGGSVYAKDLLYNRFDWTPFDLTPNKGITFRDYNAIPGTAQEHTEYVSGQLIADAINKENSTIDAYNREPPHLFNWVKYDEPARVLEGVDVSKIEFYFSASYAAEINYDRSANKYTKTHKYLPKGTSYTLVDAENGGNPVEFDNVFVLWTEITRYPDSNAPSGFSPLSKVSLSWGGVGYYFNGGKMEKVRWMKGTPLEMLRIVSLDGTETDVEINIGTSYICFVGLDYFGTFKLDGERVDVAGDYKDIGDIDISAGDGEVDD